MCVVTFVINSHNLSVTQKLLKDLTMAILLNIVNLLFLLFFQSESVENAPCVLFRSVGRAQMVQQKVSPTTPQPVVSPPQTALNPQYSTTDTSAAVAARKRKGKSDYSDIYNPAKMPCLPNQHSQPASDDFVVSVQYF